MADTVTSQTVHGQSGKSGRYVYHLTNISDGTGESGVTKVDISTLVARGGGAPSKTKVLRIDYSVSGFNYVVLRWDHTADDTIAVLKGQGVFDWTLEGGLVDPASTGGTGDILLTTNGGSSGSAYDITLELVALS